METIETKVKIDKELLEKVEEYNINIEAFLDTGFRRYVDYVVYKDKLKKHKDDVDADYLTKGFSKTELKEMVRHLDKGDEDKLDIDSIATTLSSTYRDSEDIILNAIRKLCDKSKDGYARREDIIYEAEIQKVEISQSENTLDRLKRNGQIYEPVHNEYKITEY